MTIIKDTFFGGAEKKAAKAQQQGIERGIDETRRATEEARQAVNPLFSQARQEANQGFQGALDVFAQSLPAQMQTFQQGNVGAQEQLLAGLPQFQNAILGNQVDFSQLQPTQVQTPDLGFFQQTLPEVQQQQQNAAMNSGLGPYTPNNPVFNGMMGPLQTALGGASQSAFDGLLNEMAIPQSNTFQGQQQMPQNNFGFSDSGFTGNSNMPVGFVPNTGYKNWKRIL